MTKNYKLDKEERELLDSIERGEWVSVKDAAKLKQYARYAKNTVKKNKRISIRMSTQDYIGIQTKAIEEGIPYQTLITSIVHRYISGRLVLSRKSREEE